MFKSLSKILITGFITLLPVVLTIYLLYWLAVSSEQVMGNALKLILPDTVYFPGGVESDSSRKIPVGEKTGGE